MPRLHFFSVIHDTIKQRLRGALLATPSGKTALDRAAHLAVELTDEGTWADLGPAGQAAPGSAAGSHLDRTLSLAKASHLAPGELDGPTRRAFDWWLSQDFRLGDWWQDHLSLPRQVGEIALLCEEELSLGAAGKVIEILTRARWTRWQPGEGWKEWTGAALLGVACNVILRGCLEKAPSLCDTAFRRAFKNTRWKQPGEEDRPGESGNDPSSPWVDSLFLAQDYARLITLAHGTPWQAPAESIRSFVGYLLDFLQWTMRQSVPDTEAQGHGTSAESAKLQTLALTVVQLAQMGNPPRRDELLAFAERLQGRGRPLAGHRSFWRSRVAFHQRPAFYSSLRLRSSRSLVHDFAPASAPAVGGTVYFLRNGEEYAGLHERWNLRQLPGLTAVQRDTPPGAASAAPPRLLGCVSEGEYGLGALEQAHEGVAARKAWFFFDESVACLEAGVQAPPVSHPVFSAVNQCRFQGSAFAESAARERFHLPVGQTYDLTGIRRVEHGGFLYYFPSPLRVLARILPLPGREAAAPVEAVFSLCVDHGLKPDGSGAVYLVLPMEADGSGRDRSQGEVSQVDFLANNAAVQAVRYRPAGLIGVVFWEPGVVTLSPGRRIAANRPCLLLCRENSFGGTTLSISNLLTEPATVHVEYGGRCVSFDLPGDAEAGRSLSRDL